MKHTGQDAEIKNTLDFLTDMSNGFSQHLEEASKVTDSIVAAFINGEKHKVKNDHTDGTALFLHRNKIAEKRDGKLWITNSGWMTKTTKERLNGLPNVSIIQKSGDWYLNGEKWDGDWIEVGDIEKEPELNEAKKKTSMKMEMDTNGNRVLRISSPEGSFTIQTNTNLPDIHSRKIKLDSKEAFDYVDEYLKKHGSTGKRQAVWNAYGVYSGFDKSMNESLEQLNENTKPINKKADGEFGYMAYWDKKRKLVAVYAPDTYEAKIRLMKFYKTKSTSDFSSVMKAEDDDGKQITHNANVLESAQQNLDEDSVGIPVINALKMLMAAGLKETDFKEAYGKLQDKSVSNKEYITMDNVKAVAKKYGLTLGKNVFEAYSDKNKKIDIYIDGEYAASTKWSKTTKEAIAKYKEYNPIVKTRKITAQLAEEFQLDEAKFNVKDASAIDFLSMISGTRKDNFADWAKSAGFSVDKMYQHAITQNTKGGLKAATEFGKDIMTLRVGDPSKPAYKKLESNLKKMFGESVEQLDTKTAAAVEQSGEANDVDDMLPESLYQLDEFADVGVNDNKWQPEIEPIARGIYTFNIWKNKVKSEWYGYAYVTRNGKMLAYTTGKTRPEAILALKKLVKANSKSDTATKIDEIFGLFSGKPITPEPVETEIETWTPNLKSMGYGRYTLTFWKRKGASEWYGYVSNMRDGKMKIAYIEPESSESGIIRKLKAAVTQGVELSPVNP